MKILALSEPRSKQNLEVHAQQIQRFLARSRTLAAWPALLRYAVASLFVAASYVICKSLEGISGYPLFMFLPPVFLSALLFDRKVSYFVTFLGATVAVKFFMPLQFPLSAQDVHTLVAAGAFVLVGLVTAYLVEGMRAAIGVLAENTALKEEKRKLEQELIHAHKMEAVGRAISIVAHDFKNILAPVLAAVDIFRMRASQVDEASLELLGVLENVYRNGNRLADDINSFGRKDQAQHVSLDLNAALRDNLATLRQVIKKASSLKLELSGNLPGICVDPALLDRALKNIIDNADDAMPAGGTITITTSTTELTGADPCVWGRCSPGAHVRLSIQDTGTGMPLAVQARLFEPFFTTKPCGRGTGLGMAMVADFVRHAQGCITVESRSGAGTTVSLFFPPGVPAALARPAVGAGNGCLAGR